MTSPVPELTPTPMITGELSIDYRNVHMQGNILGQKLIQGGSHLNNSGQSTLVLYYKSALGKDFKLSPQKNYWLENVFDILSYILIIPV